MEISILFIRVIILLIPGIISYFIYYKLVRKKSNFYWEDILRIFVFSVIDYLILYSVIGFISFIKNTQTQFFSYDALFNEKVYIPSYEILCATLIGVLVAFLTSLINKKQIIFRVGRFLSVTKRQSEEDVLNDFFDNWSNHWVFVRDQKRDLIYYGWVSNYSETEKDREVIINDVQVFSDIKQSKNLKLYELAAIYLTRDKNEFTIEVPQQTEGEKKNE